MAINRSRRELSIYMDIDRFIFKDNHITLFPWFTPYRKQEWDYLLNRFLFLWRAYKERKVNFY